MTAIGTIILAVSLVAAADDSSPYAGQEHREIKALSADEIRRLREGLGMGLAKAAELNHYPGPRHVLDLAEALGLTAEQKSRSQVIFDVMQASARTLGDQIVAREAELDQAFAEQSVDRVALETLLADIGALRAKLRFAHLNAHLEQRAVLTVHQVHRYDALRGYGAGGGHHDGHHDGGME